MNYRNEFDFLREAAFPNINAEKIITGLKSVKDLWQKLIIWHPTGFDPLSKDVVNKIKDNHKNVIIITLESSNKNDIRLYDFIKWLNPHHVRVYTGNNAIYQLHYFSPEVEKSVVPE